MNNALGRVRAKPLAAQCLTGGRAAARCASSRTATACGDGAGK